MAIQKSTGFFRIVLAFLLLLRFWGMVYCLRREHKVV